MEIDSVSVGELLCTVHGDIERSAAFVFIGGQFRHDDVQYGIGLSAFRSCATFVVVLRPNAFGAQQ